MPTAAPRPDAPRPPRLEAAGLLNHVFAFSSRAARMLPVAQPARYGVALERDVAWRAPLPSAPDAHLLDVYRPVGAAGPLPVVIYLHGGGFRGLDKDTHWVMGIGFANAGYLVFNVNYRLAPRHRFPAAAEDACEAWIWAVRNAARFGGDPARIVVAGESAGANLAAVVGVATAWRREEPWARAAFDEGVSPCAIAPACGILQVSDPGRFARRKNIGRLTNSVISGCFYGYVGRDEDPTGDHGLADPLVVVERAPPPHRPMAPTFLAVGTRDPLLDDTRRFAAALASHGSPVEARYYKGMEHAFHAWMVRPQARLCWGDQLRFLGGYSGAAKA
ncbi:MAG: alpha/beta hydrolase [Pseudomonadota bacterium]|nr:alpha/beta hydrolase [Pseudomonadota bacterium]